MSCSLFAPASQPTVLWSQKCAIFLPCFKCAQWPKLLLFLAVRCNILITVSPVPQLRQPCICAGAAFPPPGVWRTATASPPPVTAHFQKLRGSRACAAQWDPEPAELGFLLAAAWGPSLSGVQTCPRGWIGSCLWGWPGRRGPSPPSVLSRRPGCGRRRPHTPSAGPYLRSVPCARPLSHCSEWATGSTWEWLWSCLTLEEVKGGGAPGPGGVEGRSRAGRCHPTKEGALCKPSPVDVLSVHGDATEIHVCTSSRQCL